MEYLSQPIFAETAEAGIFRHYNNASAIAKKEIIRCMQNLLVKYDVYETAEPPVIQGIVINLEADRLKYQQMTTRLKQFGIPHKRFNAVSGREIFENFKAQGKFENNGYALRAHQVGVWQSHYAIWKTMVEQKIDKLFIFEDDCSFVHDFDVMYHKTLELVRDKDYEILFVGYSGASIDVEKELHLVDVGCPAVYAQLRFDQSRRPKAGRAHGGDRLSDRRNHRADVLQEAAGGVPNLLPSGLPAVDEA